MSSRTVTASTAFCFACRFATGGRGIGGSGVLDGAVTSLAMRTAFRAAPRRSCATRSREKAEPWSRRDVRVRTWSPHTNRSRPCAPKTRLWRSLPTSTSDLLDALSGIGYCAYLGLSAAPHLERPRAPMRRHPGWPHTLGVMASACARNVGTRTAVQTATSAA